AHAGHVFLAIADRVFDRTGYSSLTKSYLSIAMATPCSWAALSTRRTLPVQRTRIGSESVISGGSVITNSIGAPGSISVSRYMKTPRELTSRVRPASSRLPLSRNFTEIGKSSENRRVVRLSGCCAMAGLQNTKGPLALILAHVA